MASERDTLLRPINALSPLDVSPEATDGKLKYCLTSDKIDDRLFCRTRAEDGQVQITLNTQHEFYLNVYRPLFWKIPVTKLRPTESSLNCSYLPLPDPCIWTGMTKTDP